MSEERQTEVLLAIGRLEGKVDALMASHKSLELDLRSLGKRVSSLEKERSKLYGAGVVLTFIGGGIVWAISMLKNP